VGAFPWLGCLTEHSLPKDHWYRMVIGKAVALFGHAADRGEGVASMLQPPFDAERARRVQFPLERQGTSGTFKASSPNKALQQTGPASRLFAA